MKNHGDDSSGARQARLRELIHARLDGELDDAGAGELARLLESAPEADRELAGFDALARLAASRRETAPDGFAGDVMRAITVADSEDRIRRNAGGGRIQDRVRRLFSVPRPAMAGFAAGLGVVAAAAAVYVAFFGRPAPGPTVPADTPGLIVHRFELAAPEAERVCLVGDFNGWKVCEAPLEKDAETGEWTLQLELPAGRHQYMFVVDDDDWITDPEADIRVDDGFGNENAVVFL